MFVASDVSMIHFIQNQSTKEIGDFQNFLCKTSPILIDMIVSLVKCDVGCVLWILSDLLIPHQSREGWELPGLDRDDLDWCEVFADVVRDNWPVQS